MKRPIVHFEIGCNDIAKASEFYNKIFGWQLTKNGISTSINTGGDEAALPGHLNQLGPEEPENYVTIYIETDSIDEDLVQIESNGGKKVVGPLPLPDGRMFAWFEDVSGNTIGLITPNT